HNAGMQVVVSQPPMEGEESFAQGGDFRSRPQRRLGQHFLGARHGESMKFEILSDEIRLQGGQRPRHGLGNLEIRFGKVAKGRDTSLAILKSGFGKVAKGRDTSLAILKSGLARWPKDRDTSLAILKSVRGGIVPEEARGAGIFRSCSGSKVSTEGGCRSYAFPRNF